MVQEEMSSSCDEIFVFVMYVLYQKYMNIKANK
jgi:hypothetical protein